MVRITVDYGYDIHSVTIEKQQFLTIKKGDQVLVKGQGFRLEGKEVEDYWWFNFPKTGDVEVGYEDGGQLFFGSFTDGSVWIDENEPKQAKNE